MDEFQQDLLVIGPDPEIAGIEPVHRSVEPESVFLDRKAILQGGIDEERARIVVARDHPLAEQVDDAVPLPPRQ